MGDIDTIRAALEAGYRISAFCQLCDRHAWLDLPKVVGHGLGNRRLLGLSVRCSACKQLGHWRLIWPGRQ